MKKLALRALIKYLSGLVLVALLVFLPAGTLRFWNGRLLLAVLFLPMLPLGILLLVKAPELLEKRLHTREKETAQRSVIALSGLMFLAGFFLAGLDYRFQWLPLPRWASLAAAVVFLAGYGLYGEVMRENAYLSRTVEAASHVSGHSLDVSLHPHRPGIADRSARVPPLPPSGSPAYPQ